MMGGLQIAQLLLLSACLMWCICSDLLQRRIPNRAVLLLLLSWIAGCSWSVTFAQMPVITALRVLPGAMLVFVGGFLLFLTGRLGAGDVKLMSVLCLWVGDGHQTAFIMVTALAGGVLALVLPLVNTVPVMLGSLIGSINRKMGMSIALPPVLPPELSQGIPYGIAIATGAAYILIWPLV